jgi:hypothetical protein
MNLSESERDTWIAKFESVPPFKCGLCHNTLRNDNDMIEYHESKLQFRDRRIVIRVCQRCYPNFWLGYHFCKEISETKSDIGYHEIRNQWGVEKGIM